MDTTEEEHLRSHAALLDASPGFVALATLEGRMLFVSAQGRELVGMPDGLDVAGTTIRDYRVEPDTAGHPTLRDWRTEDPVPEAQRATLVSMGCRFAQGYLLGRPVPEDEVPALLLAEGS